MTNGSTTARTADDFAKAASEQAQQAFQFNMQMGKAFMDAWAQTLTQYQTQAQKATENAARTAWQTPTNPWAAMMTPPPQQPAPQNGNSASAPAEVTRVWINAVSEAMERTQDAMRRGHTVTPDTYMDIWTRAASELSQAIVSDAAFAALTGKWVNSVSGARTEAKKTATNQIREFGFATHSDVEEVGKRLIELERRVHQLTILLEDAEAHNVALLVEGGAEGAAEGGAKKSRGKKSE